MQWKRVGLLVYRLLQLSGSLSKDYKYKCIKSENSKPRKIIFYTACYRKQGIKWRISRSRTTCPSHRSIWTMIPSAYPTEQNSCAALKHNEPHTTARSRWLAKQHQWWWKLSNLHASATHHQATVTRCARVKQQLSRMQWCIINQHQRDHHYTFTRQAVQRKAIGPYTKSIQDILR